MTLLIMINALAAPVSNLVGWALPAYLSLQAIETPQHEDDIQWLTYWVVFGFFNFIESLALRPLLYYIPFFYAFKTLFVLWLQLPATRVSSSRVIMKSQPNLTSILSFPRALALSTSMSSAPFWLMPPRRRVGRTQLRLPPPTIFAQRSIPQLITSNKSIHPI